jgi:hypothetical protein
VQRNGTASGAGQRLLAAGLAQAARPALHSRLVLCLLQAVEELQAHGRHRLGRLGIGPRFGSVLCARGHRQHCPSHLARPWPARRRLRALRRGAWCCGRRGGVEGRQVVVRTRPSRAPLGHVPASRASRASQSVASLSPRRRARRKGCNHHQNVHVPVLSAASTAGSRFRPPQHRPLYVSQRFPWRRFAVA